MVVFPNAKINIGLNIVEKRPDGYHNIESIFYPIPIKDILEIVESESGATTLHTSGISIDGDPNDNLIMKAYRILSEEFALPPVDIYLEKRIPFGAGLGGGSSDAAFTLKTLNELFDLRINTKGLESYAAKLGADCAFFIQNKPTYAEGIGNLFSEANVCLSKKFIVLIKPDIHVSTKEAYAMIRPRRTKTTVCELIQNPIENWRKLITNDFETSVFPIHPRIKWIKEKLYDFGAIYASMSGSGSSVYGIFDKEIDLTTDFPDMFVFCSVLE